jgi:hypothetical protein
MVPSFALLLRISFTLLRISFLFRFCRGGLPRPHHQSPADANCLAIFLSTSTIVILTKTYLIVMFPMMECGDLRFTTLMQRAKESTPCIYFISSPQHAQFIQLSNKHAGPWLLGNTLSPSLMRLICCAMVMAGFHIHIDTQRLFLWAKLVSFFILFYFLQISPNCLAFSHFHVSVRKW